MFLGYLVLFTALTISAVAIYYSVAGLAAIFAAAVIPIIIMGVALEIGKLVTAVWLHKYWEKATWWLKTYLSIAIIVLMFITSMGIFGFLSKAHIEQTSASQESVARSQVLQQEIDRQLAIVARSEEQVKKLETTGSGADAQVQAQIDKEQERIDNAYKRIQPAIDEQNRIIGSQAKIYQDELARIDEQLATLQKYIDAGDKESIKKAQAMIGAAQDGAWGSRTSAKADEWKAARRAQRADLLTKIESATNNPQARAAANEIRRLRQSVEREIAESNRLINRLRQNIGKTDNAAEIQKSIDEQNERIRTASSEIEKLTQEKITIDSEYRKLEAEVGPIKYIAEFIYGERADTNMLEEAVRWVIVIIIFVFDPLAVLLLIAAQYTFRFHREQSNDDNERLLSKEEATVETEEEDELVQENTPPEDGAEETSTQDQSVDREVVSEDTGEGDNPTEEKTGLTAEEVAKTYSEENVEKKDSSSLETEESLAPLRLTEEQLEELENNEEWQTAKSSWKEDNPDLSLKFFKQLYLDGKIDKLPWEDYLDNPKKKSYIMKENNLQVRKTTQD